MKKVISILTTTRADYGLLKPIILKLKLVEAFDIRVVVTGTHLSTEFGSTKNELYEDGIIVDQEIEILDDGDSALSVTNTMGNALIKFGKYFNHIKPDMLIILGDRYETLAIAIAAMNQRILIAHLYGGELTEGAIDDSIRHAITKLSYLHFTSTEAYRKRVIQLGEAPERVFCVGGMGVENAKHVLTMTKRELENSLDFLLDQPFAVVTFHPETLQDHKAKEYFTEVLSALEKHKDMKYIITKANADAEGRIINQMIDDFAMNSRNCIAVASLGTRRYLSALKYASMVIGNSSSGLLEVPSFGIPTINIGQRQKGRIQATSVINCEPRCEDISMAMDKATSEAFISIAKTTINPYGNGETSDRIVEIIGRFLFQETLNLEKNFYDCEGI
ncbi:GDP/UDP-N,N'-diacetylbacillosamine 2-epimerase [Petrocella atlantisensis]|uniref:GDP/UDP-N,N'-diacetylbacillosamine 2-epimerase n=1 Tax=Petrocella atlantisensis TaxID=2173034 RepID=A0A3P7S102_9FIRM|nr:UDP-N-acetylglucosamine 2-epimerase [Petrocella atlantisensis]VDN48546.1 GDP/UDP-N,N'-diacetylbacillosamine 2-epimerase [Petrocella atlantisensis]